MPAVTIYKEIGKEIAKAIKESNKEVVIIASSDMTHYEPQESAQDEGYSGYRSHTGFERG